MKLSLLIASLLACLSLSSSYKILGIAPFPARSHYIVNSALYKALAANGHEVTVISPFPQKTPLKNYVDVNVEGVFKAMEEDINGLLDTLNRSVVENIVHFHKKGIDVTEVVLNDPNVKNLMASNQTFDLVICEVFLNEALFALADHFKAPLIGLGTFGAISWNTDMVGSPSPPSYVPSAMLPFSDRMTLLQRIANLAYLTFERLFLDNYYLPQQEKLYKKFFPHLKRSLYDIRKNAALVLLNTHVSLSFSRPYQPNHIEVGGMHINRKRKPLPDDIKKFLDEAPHGAIYFSMGSNLKSKDLALDKRQAILNTFRGLKQRVLWKFEDPHLKDKPDNVFISDWFPQDDILAHEKVLAFITHGGLLSSTESIYHGKPVIGIPVFGDQFLNMARAVINGYGIQVNYKELTEETFKTAVHKILSDKSYTQKVKEMSFRYRDQPMNPLDLAVYWVEHVARHKGASYLHCSGLDLSFIEYHNIDAMLILYGGIALVLFLILYMLRLVWRFVRYLNTGDKKIQKKSKKH